MADYTKLSSTDIQTLIQEYNIGPATAVRAMEGGQANSSFKIETRDASYILSVCDEKNPREVQSLIHILNHLEHHHFPTSRPLATRTGAPTLSHGGKPVYLKEFIPGEVKKELSTPMLNQIGTAMAALHRIPVPHQVTHEFPYGFAAFKAFLNQNYAHPFSDWLKDQLNFLDDNLDRDMPKGLIHGDIFWDNLIFDGDQLKAVLDFEEACHYYLSFDLAMAAVGCCAGKGKFDFNKVNALLQGYGFSSPHGREQFAFFLVYAATAGAFWRFCQYNIHYPDEEKKDNYKELSQLADQVRTLKNYSLKSI